MLQLVSIYRSISASFRENDLTLGFISSSRGTTLLVPVTFRNCNPGEPPREQPCTRFPSPVADLCFNPRIDGFPRISEILINSETTGRISRIAVVVISFKISFLKRSLPLLIVRRRFFISPVISKLWYLSRLATNYTIR